MNWHREYRRGAAHLCGVSIHEEVAFQSNEKSKVMLENNRLLLCGESSIPTSHFHKNEFHFDERTNSKTMKVEDQRGHMYGLGESHRKQPLTL